jgi:hypothetical protein
MADSGGIYALVVAPLLGAVGWLAKRLYDAPRPADYESLVKERDELRAAVRAASDEAKRLYDAREIELRETRAELDRLRASIERAERGAAHDTA